VNLVMRYGPQDKFGDALWATAANLVIHYEQRSCTVKTCDEIRNVAQSAGLGYVLWATAQDLVMP
jgi:hypothetical protein